MPSVTDKLNQLKKEFETQLSAATTIPLLEAVRIDFLGRKGKISHLMESLKKLPLDEKKVAGPLYNDFKQYAEQAYNEKHKLLLDAQIAQEIAQASQFDVTAYKPNRVFGSLHPLTLVSQRLEDIFISMGFSVLRGPEVETDYHNFEALNIPKDHPAREMFDTFWIDVPNLLLRTHTSPVQIHALLSGKLPLAIIAPGRCYRHEATDASHDFMFMQLEGMVVDTDISMSNLLATLKTMFNAFFDKQSLNMRVRPSYFPFVEPGIEADIQCPFCTNGCSVCKQSGWIEMGGAGLIHPNVLRNCGIDADAYSGFAFGFGLTRLTMLLYGINDIRLLHSGKIEFLEQF
jgi:phenylalanyl-tRNA synthetase alpha chain